MMMKALASSLLIAALILFVSPPAFADDSADQLFAEAMNLIAEENYEDAIPKLEEAQRIDPGIGTQFNLAACYAKTGRLAKAWRNLVEVERLAHTAGKTQREEAARELLAELKPRVSHLVLRVEDQPTAKITVRVDGELLSPSDYAFIPLEHGEHTIEATAPSKKSFEMKLTIDQDGVERVVVVPVLKSEAPTVFRQEVMSSRRVAGSITGAIGGIGLIAFGVTGVMILSAKSTADERCKPECVTATGEPDEEGNDAIRRGKTLLPINLVAGIVGVVGLGVSAIYLFTTIGKPPPKKPNPATVRISPTLSGLSGVF